MMLMMMVSMQSLFLKTHLVKCSPPFNEYLSLKMYICDIFVSAFCQYLGG